MLFLMFLQLVVTSWTSQTVKGEWMLMNVKQNPGGWLRNANLAVHSVVSFSLVLICFYMISYFNCEKWHCFFFFPDCKNTIGEADCQLRMMRGECADNPVFMSLNCKYTCGFCSKKNSFILISSNVSSFLRLSLTSTLLLEWVVSITKLFLSSRSWTINIQLHFLANKNADWRSAIIPASQSHKKGKCCSAAWSFWLFFILW